MPRYRFHIANGRRDLDDEGVVLPDEQAARLLAVQHAGELLQEDPAKLLRSGQWRVEVMNDQGILLCTVIALAIDAPTAETQSVQ